MPLRTDTFDLGGLRLSTGEGRRLELYVAIAPFELAGERYGVQPLLVPVRVDISRTTGDGYALRLRFEATLVGPLHALSGAGRAAVRGRCPGGVAAGIERRGAELAIRDAGVLDLQAWARDALALALPGDAPVPGRLRRPVLGVRGGPEHRRPGARARARARPALVEAFRAAIRVTPAGALDRVATGGPASLPRHGRPQAEAIPRPDVQRRAQHKISAPGYNACPQCHSPRLPHRVCPVCGSYKGREVSRGRWRQVRLTRRR